MCVCLCVEFAPRSAFRHSMLVCVWYCGVSSDAGAALRFQGGSANANGVRFHQSLAISSR